MEEKKFDVVAHVRGVLGLTIGGVAGFFLFQWLVSQGFYALAIPGALMGLACGYASRIYSIVLAIVCGVSAAGLLVFIEWKVFWANNSFVFFLTHLHELSGLRLVMLALGIVFAAWFGLGRPNPPR
jgi:uncharacterized membrane protein (Fun14 family)